MTVSELTERELIARIQQRLPPAPPWVVVGIGDDAAVVEPARNRLDVLTADTIVEGVHFDRRFTPPQAVGHRALAVNLSDLAAMGAAPRMALLSLALPGTLPCLDFDGIVEGLASLAASHRVHVVGGNLTRIPGPLVVDVTAVGSVKRRRVLTRRGARAGDEIYMTGTVGAAVAGLQFLKATERREAPAMMACVERYLYPLPRVRAGMVIGRSGAASACMDMSDGLADAVLQVAGSSGVGAILDADALPIEPGAREWFAQRGVDPVLEAMAGGDDYELLLTVPRKLRRRFLAVARTGGVPMTRIGVCTPDREVVVRGQSGDRPVEMALPLGFSHFR